MIKKTNRYTIIAILLAFVLKRITYAIGDFDFATAPLFSLYSLYDFIIFIIYGLIIQYVINKIMAKKDQNKEKQ